MKLCFLFFNSGQHSIFEKELINWKRVTGRPTWNSAGHCRLCSGQGRLGIPPAHQFKAGWGPPGQGDLTCPSAKKTTPCACYITVRPPTVNAPMVPDWPLPIVSRCPTCRLPYPHHPWTGVEEKGTFPSPLPIALFCSTPLAAATAPWVDDELQPSAWPTAAQPACHHGLGSPSGAHLLYHPIWPVKRGFDPIGLKPDPYHLSYPLSRSSLPPLGFSPTDSILNQSRDRIG
jgi:hypothetical protein